MPEIENVSIVVGIKLERKEERWFASGTDIEIPINDRGPWYLPELWNLSLNHKSTTIDIHLHPNNPHQCQLLGVELLEWEYMAQEIDLEKVDRLKQVLSDRLKVWVGYNGPIGVFLVESSA